MLNKYFVLKLVLILGLMDLLSIIYLMFFYVTSVDVVFLVNFNFILLTILLGLGALGADFRLVVRNRFFSIIFFLILVSILKLQIGLLGWELDFYYILTYSYALLIMVFSLLFVSRFGVEDYLNVFNIFYHFARIYLTLAVFLISVYAILYFSGVVSYFGMGVNLHYAVPFFVKNGLGFFVALFSIVILSGKRAVMVNFLVQYAFYYLYLYRNNRLFLFFLTAFLFSLIYFLVVETNMLYRFEALFTVKWDDSMSLVAAFGGRFEEILGIINYFKDHPLNLLFGAPPGDFYIYIASTGSHEYNDPRNFSHVGPASFLFRYGLVFTCFFYLYCFYLLVRYFNPGFPFYLVFVGILSSSFFGANLFSDPIAWVFIGFFLKYRHVSLNLKKSLR